MNRGRYNGPAFNGAGSVTLPGSLLEAIRAYFLASPALTAAIPGGLWDRFSRRSMPFATASLVSSRKTFTTTDYYQEDVLVQFTAVATTDAQAYAMGKAILAAFKPRQGYSPLAWASGSEIVRLPGNELLMDVKPIGQAGANAWQYVLEFSFLCNASF